MERDDKERQQPSDGGKAQPRAGAAADRLRLWRLISGQLTTLIGESGFCALFGRALRTLAVRYDWLSVDASRKSIDGLLTALEHDLASVESTVADIAAGELLNTFTRQLSSLIGEALTARLIEQAAASGRTDRKMHRSTSK